MKRYISLNGRLVPYEQATIHIASVAMRYAASVFEGIRGYWDNNEVALNIFSLSQHIDRLFDSMSIMRMEPDFSPSELKRWIIETIYANSLQEDCYIRCTASVLSEAGIDAVSPVLLSIDTFPLARKPKSKGGISICTSSWTRISVTTVPPRLKCVSNYHIGRLAMIQAKADGYDNVVLLNQLGKITEAPTACIFIVKDNQLMTPTLSSGILDSITRKFILKSALELELSPVEKELDRTECYLADEIFLCGTGAEILPVISIDHYKIGNNRPGKITKLLTDHYFSVVRSGLSRHNDIEIVKFKVEQAS